MVTLPPLNWLLINTTIYQDLLVFSVMFVYVAMMSTIGRFLRFTQIGILSMVPLENC